MDISSYQRKISDNLYEIHNQLKMFEELFTSYTRTTIVLLNKWDLLEEYIKRVPLSVSFPHYDGPGILNTKSRLTYTDDAEEAYEFIKQEFLRKVPKRSPIYFHRTQSNNIHNCKVIFRSIKDICTAQCLSNMA